MSRRTACVPEDRVLKVLTEDDSILCTGCGSMDSVRFGRTARGTQRYRCSACGRTFVLALVIDCAIENLAPLIECV